MAALRRVAPHGPVVLVGISMGGRTLTGVGNTAPELVSRLVYLTPDNKFDVYSVDASASLRPRFGSEWHSTGRSEPPFGSEWRQAGHLRGEERGGAPSRTVTGPSRLKNGPHSRITAAATPRVTVVRPK